MTISVSLVEDNDQLRATLARVIGRAEGFKCVSQYANAEAALAGLPKDNPEVVLMDINLPGMNGVECARQLKQVAPHLLEEIYNLEDALLVGGLINALVRHSDRVKVACLAQLVNVIAPIMTNESGLYRQTIFYPYAWALQYARGAALRQLVESPTYDVAGMGAVPFVDAAATFDKESGKTALFVVNRDLQKPHDVEVIWEDGAPSRVTEAMVLSGNDLKAFNSFEAPRNVAPQTMEKPVVKNGKIAMQVPARSYSMIQFTA